MVKLLRYLLLLVGVYALLQWVTTTNSFLSFVVGLVMGFFVTVQIYHKVVCKGCHAHRPIVIRSKGMIEATAEVKPQGNNDNDDLKQALLNLGYSVTEAKDAVIYTMSQCEDKSLEDKIRFALNYLNPIKETA